MMTEAYCTYTEEDIAQIRCCTCGGNHQIDGKGIELDGSHATTCPNDPTFNPAFAAWVAAGSKLPFVRSDWPV
jgi:hypothetical protein